MIVADASVIVDLVVFADAAVAARLAGEDLHAPHLLDVEVAQVVRRLVAAGALDATGGRAALRDLVALPIVRHGQAPLLERVFGLRANLTAYDAVYVALAEALAVPLLSRDARLARAPGIRARVEVV